ncbi:peptide/nickel transport system ATP-binding protein/oligopeptide transport system ATP-binding protein [Bacillus oleivorans]|uniref:Peptide/nickel transport system ATP-binding protein/oligopeptide transport system ATP-binding protein n=1 Tax=Bacillus oleivorans TaxID=1448271 RepID=A0A285D531_9BACI|nr:ABC transporter ATP-binding protein [Bacillus oleivorans]SNX74456.1 peptide/nickel transport system ATP-binding protein/oligopeptide transport system ATP-binding protein [Bacillus oleivorans]
MDNSVLVRIKGLNKRFIKKSGPFFNRKTQEVYAVNNLNLEIKRGEILGIIGESGCGKTTTARIMMRLMKESSGEIWFDNADLCKLSESQTKKIRKKMQMIFQDPYDTLNPGMRIVDILMEPLNAHEKELSHQKKFEKVKQAIESIDLKPAEDFIYRYPHQLSGGQRQRIAIARAIILKPLFIAADEPTSMLDVSVRAGILNLLKDLKKKMGLTMMFITHDLSTASYMCDRIAVMYQGKIVEVGPTKKIIQAPTHPYTKALVSVVKDLNYFIANKEYIILDGEVDSTREIVGCPFVARCPHRESQCHTIEPRLENLEQGHFVSCHCHHQIIEKTS